MKASLSTFAGLLLAAWLPVGAQAQIKPATAPTTTRPVTVAPHQPANTVTPVDDAIRGQLSVHPISSKGPSHAELPAQPRAPLRVYDRNGRPLQGMKPAGPGRVLDTRTGRYHDTVPSGDGQRITH